MLVGSRGVAEAVSERCRVPMARIHVTGYGVDHARFAPPPEDAVAAGVWRGSASRARTCCRSGRWSRGAGRTWRWRRARRCASAIPGCELVLVGDVRADVPALREPPPWVRRLGRVADDALPALYAGAAAVLAPSRGEGFDLPVLEALACGGAVVASDIAVHREHFAPAVALFASGDAEALAAALTRVLEDAEACRALRAAGPALAARFSWAEVARRHLEVVAHAGAAMRAGAVVVNFNGGDDLARLPGRPAGADGAGRGRARGLRLDRRHACRSPSGRRRACGGVPLAENVGYAGGCAAGLAALDAGVEVIGFFNPDCAPAAEFFAVCLDVLARAPRRRRRGGAPRAAGGRGARLLRPGADAAAAARARPRATAAPAAGRFAEPATVLAACGAAMVYRRAALAAAAVAGEVFPADFFAFWEDLDLGWRVSAAGWPRRLRAARRGDPPPRRDRRARRGAADLPAAARARGRGAREPLGHAGAQPAPG